jgi:hypothetical protein
MPISANPELKKSALHLASERVTFEKADHSQPSFNCRGLGKVNQEAESSPGLALTAIGLDV